ncbi:DUF4270 family protein [Aurantibacter crassamenti]|uniref:DUF4270 domain-containing protein n=1 Tax=Aurantibacter crassamenti TaxID=1837375 RepID=UPI00193AB358|nr:DUF4270 domain-containing protein [Aurantibacter crassamenti]MBM1104871.1 DUF4270 family protein [Aurantibacter crassamenti]
MNFLKRIKLPVYAGFLLVAILCSCTEEPTTIGATVIGSKPFSTSIATYNVKAFNKKIEAVQTNKLPIYQLGVFNDPVYGKTVATINSQVQLSTANPSFGIYTQNTEDTNSDAIPENETIDSVVVYLPYQLNQLDSDADGVPDSAEVGDDILDATNDSDNDGISNVQETSNGTNPQNPDTDGDGIPDGTDDSLDVLGFAETFELDSIYGNRSQSFKLKVERSTYYLRDLDPNTDYQEAQEYYSNQEFSPTFTEEVLFEGDYLIDNKEYILPGEEDDPDTEENEATVTKVAPGIRVKLDPIGVDYFQTNILDKEGSTELFSAANFKDFFRGINISVTPSDSELLFLLNLANARIEVYYHYDRIVDADTTEELTASFNLSLVTSTSGNAVNTFINDDYPSEISNTMFSEENASRLYLKGGSGTYAEIQLFEDESEINEIKAKNWIINEANLVFYVDQDAVASIENEPPRLYMFNAETNAPLFNVATEYSTEDTPLEVYLNYDGLIEKSGEKGVKYTVNITNHLNNIIVRDSVNATLGIQVPADVRITAARNVILANGTEMELPVSSVLTPLSTVLYGSNVTAAEDDMKLKLQIFYTETN